jgi:predicted methyltransferase
MGIEKLHTFQTSGKSQGGFTVVEPGKTVMDWKGARVYLDVVDLQSGGGFFEEIKAGITKAAGKQAADMIHAAVRFKITEVRPVVEF